MSQPRQVPFINRALAISAALAVAVFVPPATAQEHPAMPPGMSHEEHMQRLAEMNKRGNTAMGFDQDKASHHFRLTPRGGTIEVRANDSADEAMRRQIRDHLRTISQEFANGVFTGPIATHAEEPPGVPVLRERKALITYAYDETPEGARVTITAKDRTARNSVHEFLKYQIREHATGDSMSVQK